MMNRKLEVFLQMVMSCIGGEIAAVLFSMTTHHHLNFAIAGTLGYLVAELTVLSIHWWHRK